MIMRDKKQRPFSYMIRHFNMSFNLTKTATKLTTFKNQRMLNNQIHHVVFYHYILSYHDERYCSPQQKCKHLRKLLYYYTRLMSDCNLSLLNTSKKTDKCVVKFNRCMATGESCLLYTTWLFCSIAATCIHFSQTL